MSRAPEMPVLRLLRFQNVFTAAADAFGGYGWTGTWDWKRAAITSAASACLYMGGMAINDLCDAERDRRLHPARPIPMGKVSPAQAFAIGGGLIAAGVLIAATLGPRVAAVAAQIALFVVAYDALLKKWRLPGAAAMGLLRGLNFAMGMAAGGALFHDPPAFFAPATLATFVFVLTFLSTFEEGPKTRGLLGLGIVLAAAALLAPLVFVRTPLRAAVPLGLAAGALLWTGFRGLRREPDDFLPAVIRTGVRAIIPFNAAVLLATLDDPVPGLVVLAFLVPTFGIGKFLRGS
ncbi:MAG: UbiA family prenyltransferase [Planctomycetes bacterium]|nr:UbiA family prenyltransferase [Planctomycetota bacterium]